MCQRWDSFSRSALVILRFLTIAGLGVASEEESRNVDGRIEGRGGNFTAERSMSHWALLQAANNPEPVDLQREWRELLNASDDPFAVYQSPEWLEHTCDVEGTAGSPIVKVIRRDRRGRLTAVVPLFLTRERCRFPLVLGRGYQTRPIEMIRIASGCPLMQRVPECFDDLFNTIHKSYPRRVLKIQNVPSDGPLFNYLHRSKVIKDRYLLSRVPGLDKVHVIPLPAEYDQFLERATAARNVTTFAGSFVFSPSTPAGNSIGGSTIQSMTSPSFTRASRNSFAIRPKSDRTLPI